MFFAADRRAEGGRHWIFSLTKSSLFSIKSQTLLIVLFFLFTKWKRNRCLMRVEALSTVKLLPGANEMSDSRLKKTLNG